MNPSPKPERRQKKTVAILLKELACELRALRALVGSPAPYVVRNDRDAARIAGFRSTYRFSCWAVARGLKPLTKGSHERTVYRVADLMKACDTDIDRQKKSPP
jgi:hypothetical protein